MHAISVYLLRKEDIRDEKISQVLDNKSQSLKYTELNCGIIAMTSIPNLKEFGKNKTIAKVSTNYFGGETWKIGLTGKPVEQSAKLIIDNKTVYNKNDDGYWSIQPINHVLKEMGVKKTTGMDEFDTIGLGRYRTNEDFK